MQEGDKRRWIAKARGPAFRGGASKAGAWRTQVEDLLAWHITGTEIFEVSTAARTQLFGQVRWFPRWRRYSFFPYPDQAFESSCLRDIADFCERETRERRSMRRKAREAYALAIEQDKLLSQAGAKK